MCSAVQIGLKEKGNRIRSLPAFQIFALKISKQWAAQASVPGSDLDASSKIVTFLHTRKYSTVNCGGRCYKIN